MITLKAQAFGVLEQLVKFVDVNQVKREDILEITHGKNLGDTPQYTIFFYGDSEIKEKTPNFWGNWD